MELELKKDILIKCKDMEIPIVGVADIARWKDQKFSPWIPEEFHPDKIFPEARSVIVIGLPVSLPVLETSPSIYYRELYKTVNSLLDQYTYRLSEYLNQKGHASIFVSRDGYGSIKVLIDDPIAFFSHRHAAYLAGLGNFGVNNTILTPEYGPRVRFGCIFTSAELPPDNMIEEHLCIHCMRCVRMCPVNALAEDDYPNNLTNKIVCATYSEKLNEKYISPCGICIKVCPIGKDREHFKREDTSIYETDKNVGNSDEYSSYHNAWEHVRKYSGRIKKK